MVLAKEETKKSMGQNTETRQNPHEYSLLVFDIGAKLIKWRKDSLSTSGVGTTERPYAKHMTIDRP